MDAGCAILHEFEDEIGDDQIIEWHKRHFVYFDASLYSWKEFMETPIVHVED